MTRTVAIIGAGQIGYAAASCFHDAGWDVRIHARSRPVWPQFSKTWRAYTIGHDPAPAADVVFDTIAYDETDVACFDPDAIGRYITVSTASVYADHQGRGFEDAATLGFPEFESPITEDQPLIAPGPMTYSSRKVRMEQKAFAMFGERATFLRPCAIYGEYSRQPREWWFVKRMLDAREVIPLAFEGQSRFHTTNVKMIGAFALWAAQHDLGGAFNLADQNAPSVLEIGETIASIMGMSATLHGFVGPPKDALGRTPWSLPKPFVISSEKAVATGCHPSSEAYDPFKAVKWLCKQPLTQWEPLFPVLANYGYELFDYKAEDRFFAEH